MDENAGTIRTVARVMNLALLTFLVAQLQTAAAVSAGDFVMFTDSARVGWNVAHQECGRLGMSLATLDQNSSDYLKRLAHQGWYKQYAEPEFWIGLFYTDSNDATSVAGPSSTGFSWSEDCEPLSPNLTSQWDKDEPSNVVDKPCVAVAKGRWRTEKCQTRLQFLCKTTKSTCDNGSFPSGYDNDAEIHRSDCFSFRFNHSEILDDGSNIPKVTCKETKTSTQAGPSNAHTTDRQSSSVTDSLIMASDSSTSLLSSDTSPHNLASETCTTTVLPISAEDITTLTTEIFTPLTEIPTPLGQLSTPPLAELSTPPLAELSTPPLGQLSTPPLGQVSTPPLGQLSTPPLGQVSTPPSGQLSTPPLGQLSTPPLGDLSTPLGDLSTPPLGDPSTPLAELSTSLGELSTPLGELSTPLGELSTPLGQLSTPPLGQLSTPLGELSTPLGELSTPLGQLSTPPLGELSTPLGELSTSLGELSTPLGELSTSPLGELSTSMEDTPTTIGETVSAKDGDASTPLADLSTPEREVIFITLGDLSTTEGKVSATVVDLFTTMEELSTTVGDATTSLGDVPVQEVISTTMQELSTAIEQVVTPTERLVPTLAHDLSTASEDKSTVRTYPEWNTAWSTVVTPAGFATNMMLSVSKTDVHILMASVTNSLRDSSASDLIISTRYSLESTTPTSIPSFIIQLFPSQTSTASILAAEMSFLMTSEAISIMDSSASSFMKSPQDNPDSTSTSTIHPATIQPSPPQTTTTTTAPTTSLTATVVPDYHSPARWQCPCSCNRNFRWSPLSNLTFLANQAVETIKMELTVERKTLSSMRRRRESTEDSRTSAAGIGVVGLALVTSFVVVVVALDVEVLVLHFRKGVPSCTCKHRVGQVETRDQSNMHRPHTPPFS